MTGELETKWFDILLHRLLWTFSILVDYYPLVEEATESKEDQFAKLK